MLAVICDITGASPDGALGLLLLNDESVATNIINDNRRRMIIREARNLLRQKKPWTEVAYPLGRVMDCANGQCHVVYQYFDGDDSNSWVRDAQILINQGLNAWVTFRKDTTSGTSSVLVLAATDKESQEAKLKNQLRISPATATEIINSRFERTFLLTENTRQILLLPVKAPPGPVTIIGRHRVAVEIIRILAGLPVNVQWTAENFFETDPTGSSINRIRCGELTLQPTDNSPVVIIMSNDHQQDLRLCEQALRQAAVQFVGCIGSNKKAALLRKQLMAKGISQAALNNLHMPVGLADISGKHPAVIAVSVVAQILTVYQAGSEEQLTLSRLTD